MPSQPRNEAAENRHILDAFDCVCFIFQSSFAPLVAKIRPDLPKLSALVCLDAALPYAPSGGFNIYSVEVEQALQEHPDVQNSAVVGLPDEKWGERVAAVTQLHAGSSVPPEVIAFAKARIGSVKAPKSVEVWPDLPRSKVGKVVKKQVKNRLLSEQTSREEV